MEFIYSSDCRLHDTGSHPECIDRLEAFQNLPDHEADGTKYLELIHSKQHIEKIRQFSSQALPIDGDTLTSPHSFQAAAAAVGGSILASESNGFALGRPPGHHAYPQRASGFCLFNNVAIAVKRLSEMGKRVFVLDIDGHLGDGTSAIFYNDPKVLFCSLHQYPAFPGNGWIDEIGIGPGEGFTINVPMPAGSADDIFLKGIAFVEPIAKSFNPDVVAVSAGFDAHQYDPLLQLNLSLNGFHKCGEWLTTSFKEVFAVLEGGYNLEVLPKAITAFQRGCNQLPPKHRELETISADHAQATFERNLSQLQHHLQPYWSI